MYGQHHCGLAPACHSHISPSREMKKLPPWPLPQCTALHTAALGHNHPFFWIKHHCHILSPWTKTQKWIGSDSFSHTFSIKVEIKSRSKLNICPQSTACYKEQIGLKLIIYWREERCHLLFYNLLPRARHRSGRWAGKGGCVNGFGHYQYFGRGWGVQGQSGHLDTPHPGTVYFVCYNLLSSISKTSVSWKNSRRLVLVTPSAMEWGQKGASVQSSDCVCYSLFVRHLTTSRWRLITLFQLLPKQINSSFETNGK